MHAPERMRVEHDSLGAVDVPADAFYGAHTARALANFTVSGHAVSAEPELVRALAEVKAAAARANAELGVLREDVAGAIVAAAREIAAGALRDQFPVDLVQGGGGTATNMNANEVIANRAEELLGGRRGDYRLVHPNDAVNRSQSTNDVYPTALAIAAVRVGRDALAGIEHARETLLRKAAEVGELVRIGRTCLQDAVPFPAAARHRADAAALARTGGELGRALDALLAVPLGATAVGTGVGAPAGYRERVVRLLADETGLEIVAAPDLYDSLAHLDPYAAVASALERVALVLARTAADLRFLASGPVGGAGELLLPAVQVGSSIMPGKVNPAIPELVLQIGYEIRGATHTIELAVAAGEQELNVMEPVIARHLLGSLRDAGRVARLFADRCIAGAQWNEERVAANRSGSYEPLVALALTDGYEAAARRAQGDTDR